MYIDKQKELMQKEKNDWETILKTEQGKRVIGRILNQCGIYRTSYSKDAIEMAFMEGQRNIGLYISEKILDIDYKSIYTIQELLREEYNMENKNGK